MSGASLQQREAAFLEVLAGLLEPFVQMLEPFLVFEAKFVVYADHFMAVRGKMQLDPRSGPSCNKVVTFRFRHNAGSGAFKVLFLTHRS